MLLSLSHAAYDLKKLREDIKTVNLKDLIQYRGLEVTLFTFEFNPHYTLYDIVM